MDIRRIIIDKAEMRTKIINIFFEVFKIIVIPKKTVLPKQMRKTNYIYVGVIC